MRGKSLKLCCFMGLASSVVIEFRETDGDLTRFESHHLQIDPVPEAGRFVLELDDGISVETIDASAGLG